MLRRKLLAVLGSLLLLLVGTAIGAVWSLQGVLRQLNMLGDQLRHAPLIANFRWLVLILALVFIVVINISILVLLRAAAMVTRPMDRLIEGTRELGKGRFDHRVRIEQNDEFGELARAYNSLAADLEAGERKKLEMIGQVALTLNHELNNAMSMIELQLQLLAKQSNGCSGVEKYSRQIREGLARMTATVDALKHVRRIVLTDYISGVKMLDLERSVRETDDTLGDHHVPRAHVN